MSLTSFVFCLLISAGLAGPDDLIAGLAAPRYADREAAASGLESLGRAALPSLRANRRHRDLEVRSRVVALIEKIEGSLLLQSTSVRLDFADRPLVEILAEINRRTGLHLVLSDHDKGLGARKFTLNTATPLPFWGAIDRLCDATGLEYTLTNPGPGTGREPGFVLSTSVVRPGGPISDHGPFRVNLMSLHYQRDLNFVNQAQPLFLQPGMAIPKSTPGAGRVSQEQFYARLQISAEPGLALTQAGVAKVVAAVDESGQPLQPSATGVTDNSMFMYYGMSVGPVQFQVPLRRPEKAGRSIKVFRGTVPVSVSTRKADPLVVLLASSVGKTFRNDDVSVVVHELKSNPNTHQQSIEISVTNSPSRSRTEVPVELDFMSSRVDVGPMQVELADSGGKPVPWFVSGSSQNGEENRVTLTVLPGPDGSVSLPTSLRYHGTTRTLTEIPFEFRDVPMP